MKRRLLSPSAYARHRGCTHQYISRLIQVGLIPTNHGKIDPIEADKKLAESKDPSRALPKPHDASSFSAARTRRELCKAALAEIQLRRLKDELIPVEEVLAIWTHHILDCRSKLLRLPSKMAPLIFGLKTLPEMKKALDNEIRKALEELAAIDTKALVPRRRQSQERV